MNIRLANLVEEAAVNVLARMSPFTRDFANPPMSLKAMRAVAFMQNEVWVAVNRAGRIGGFCWCRPMKPKHMPFSTVYYMGVDPEFKRQGLARQMLEKALDHAKEGCIQLVCEDRNEEARKFYNQFMWPIMKGYVGKDNRPYTRWEVTKDGPF